MIIKIKQKINKYNIQQKLLLILLVIALFKSSSQHNKSRIKTNAILLSRKK